MPRDGGAELTHRATAIASLDEAMAGWGGARLTPSELRVYGVKCFTDGWRISVEFSDGLRRLDVIIDAAFPWSAIRIALVDSPTFLAWPHVERDGLLCLLGSAAEVSPYDPVGVAKVLLKEAANLIEDILAGRLEDDFASEFLSYWDWASTPGAPWVRSLLEPRGPSRKVRAWRGRGFYLLGEEDAALSDWLRNFTGKSDPPLHFEDAMLVWRASPPVPRQYPNTASALMALTDDDSRPLLTPLVEGAPDRLVVAVGAPTDHGATFGALTLVPKLAGRRGGDSLHAGFRPGRAPPAIVQARYLGSCAIMRSSVERADPAWVHGRDQDPRQSILQSATATILGAGSLGAPSAMMLAQAGVGRLRIADPEFLTSANTGRHTLGARQVRQMKARALAERIANDFPHIMVEAFPVGWEDLPADFGLFERSDVVVSTIGRWAAEGALNAAHRASRSRTPLLFGWTEAHGCAGHAVAIGAEGGCFQCGVDVFGAPHLQVTAWPNGDPLCREPACGATFQPYGPAEIGYTISLISELALDCLLGEVRASAHRIWTGTERRLRAAGGTWADPWRERFPDRSEGGFMHEEPWTLNASCPECGRRAAAA